MAKDLHLQDIEKQNNKTKQNGNVHENHTRKKGGRKPEKLHSSITNKQKFIFDVESKTQEKKTKKEKKKKKKKKLSKKVLI